MELTVDQILQQGVAAHNAGDLQEAERLYRAILQVQPKHPDANHNLGLIAVSMNQSGMALPLFKSAIDVNPNIEQFWLSYIEALITERQFKNAKQALKKGKKKGVAKEKLKALTQKLVSVKAGNTPIQAPSQAEMQKLINHYQNGQYGDTETLAISITEQFPRHEFGWKVLGAVLSQTGRVSESLVAYQKSVELAPQDAEARSNLGITLKELGRLEEAEASYRQAITLKPDFAAAHYNMGITLKELGRLEEAEASYRQAISVKPDYAEAHNNLGITLNELGRLEESEASYRQAITLKPDYAEAHNNLGNTLKELGRLEEAEASYRQAISVKPDYAEAHNNLGAALNELGRLEEAEATLGQAIALKPDYIDAFMNRWDLLFKKREFEAALKDADFWDTKLSRLHSLETLYALGRIKEIYQRIEMQSEVDDGNLGVAAFASFITNKEKKGTADNFCNEPLEFLHFANVSSYLQDANVFIKELVEELHDVKTIWEPSEKATRKGFQTAKNINLFANPSVKVAYLKSIIVEELDLYYLKFQKKSCSYIQKWPTGKNLWGWHVILKHQGHQTAHIHQSGWLSGVIYLKVVPALGRDEGAIEFSLDGENYSDDSSPKIVHQPTVGDIVFFPSSLHHRTIPFTTDTDRIIVSFDLMPESARHQFTRLT